MYHYAGNNPVKYTDLDGREDDIDIVRSWIYDAVLFISKNTGDEYDTMIANKLTEMINNGKIQLDDVTKRYETPRHKGHSNNTFAFFDPFRNTETNEQRNTIVIDIQKTLETGYAELIDTLTHEGWHAVQGDLKLIEVDANNNSHFHPSLEDLEADAYYLGNRMYNKYAIQNNIEEKRLHIPTRRGN